MKLYLRTVLFIAIACLLSDCKGDTPVSAANEYCNCVNKHLSQNLNTRRTICLKEIKKKYILIKQFFDNQYNDRVDTIDVKERKTINQFGYDFIDAVEKSKCCEIGWGCRPDSLSTHVGVVTNM